MHLNLITCRNLENSLQFAHRLFVSRLRLLLSVQAEKEATMPNQARLSFLELAMLWGPNFILVASLYLIITGSSVPHSMLVATNGIQLYMLGFLVGARATHRIPIFIFMAAFAATGLATNLFWTEEQLQILIAVAVLFQIYGAMLCSITKNQVTTKSQVRPLSRSRF